MRNGRAKPRVSKRFVVEHDGYRVMAVDAFAVRDTAKPDEEFDNFATQDEFPNLIPAGEIWISDKTLEKEGIFFIANALARLKEREHGASESRAYDAGIEAERLLREKINGVKFRDGTPHARVPEEIYTEHYATIPDGQFPVEVWRVDGNLVRSYYKTDYTEGGHGYVYDWVPRHEIWVEKDLERRELPFIVAHEYTEMRLMRDEAVEYDKAHEICAQVEFELRKGEPIQQFVVRGPRKFGKRDLPRLTNPVYFAHVVRRFLKRRPSANASGNGVGEWLKKGTQKLLDLV